MASFDISELYQNAFGSQPPVKFSIDAAEDIETVSSLGQPYYQDDFYGREMFMPIRLNGYLIPFAVVSIDRKKTIVETPMVERNGSVVEIVSTENHVINVKGIFIRPDNTFPESELIELNDIFEINAAIEMRSALTDIYLKGDDKVVLRRKNLPAVSGVQHAKPFELDFISDTIFNLEVR